MMLQIFALYFLYHPLSYIVMMISEVPSNTQGGNEVSGHFAVVYTYYRRIFFLIIDVKKVFKWLGKVRSWLQSALYWDPSPF